MTERASRHSEIESLRDRLGAPAIFDALGTFILKTLTSGTQKERIWAADAIIEVVIKSSGKTPPERIQTLFYKLQGSIENLPEDLAATN